MVSLFYFGPPKVVEEKKEVDGKKVVTKTTVENLPEKQPDSLRNPYNFMVQLMMMVRDTKMSNETNAVRKMYLENRSKF